METANKLYQTLESKIVEVLKNYQNSQEEVRNLQVEIEKLNEKLASQRILNEELKDKNDALKIANALGGNGEHRRLMKLKVNSLVKEIDKCIQLIDYTAR